MKILILAGGTGSVALQGGLHSALSSRLDGVEVRVLTNAYDNGLSTGAVRQVMGGHILGPSDVRKNQTTRLRLEQPTSPWLKFLDIRFSSPAATAQALCMRALQDLRAELMATQHESTTRPDFSRSITLVAEAIEEYFKVPAALKIDYNDFSLANIIYAGFAHANGRSLRRAATIMSNILGIADHVLLNSDESLFLNAVTRTGRIISDEGDIVCWGNHDDPIQDIFFTDAEGHEQEPVLCKEARAAIIDADLIILSSGTQWSSLIPTYASVGFREAMLATRAQVVAVMNRVPDRDSPGQGASDIVRALVPRFFSPRQLHVILSSDGHAIMRDLDAGARELVAGVTSARLAPAPDAGTPASPRHDPSLLFAAIAQAYFKDQLNSDHFMFDYDDTLVGRGNSYPKTSAFNVQALLQLQTRRAVSICSGNSIRALSLRGDTNLAPQASQLQVFADGGINQYEYDTLAHARGEDAAPYRWIQCIDPAAAFESSGALSAQEIRQRLRDHDIPLSKIENRGDAMICIRPIDDEYRASIVSLIKYIFKHTAPRLQIRQAGRSTIEIALDTLSKAAAVKFIFAQNKCKMMTYVGDELYSGNDEPVRELCEELPLRCLHVRSPNHTAFFLMALQSKIVRVLES